MVHVFLDTVEEFSTPGFSLKTINKPTETVYNFFYKSSESK
jgi:hypothetical protein